VSDTTDDGSELQKIVTKIKAKEPRDKNQDPRDKK